MPGFHGQCQHLPAGGFHFFTAGDEVRPIGSLHQNIGEERGDQLPWGVLVEEGNRVNRGQRGAEFSTLVLVHERPRGPFHSGDARVRVEPQYQDVSKRPRLLQQPDMAGVKQVVTAVRKDHGSAGLSPLVPGLKEFGSGIQSAHRWEILLYRSRRSALRILRGSKRVCGILHEEGDSLSLDISSQTEARLAANARELGLSVEAYIEKLMNDAGELKKSARKDNTPKVPIRHLGARGSYHRRDIYDDVG